MGNKLTFPLYPRPICYFERVHCLSTGDIKEGVCVRKEPNAFEEVTVKFFSQLMDIRQESTIAKNKIKELNAAELCEDYPMWSEDDILDFKAQFQTFDINQDGLIDFHELCCVLSELGDNSDMETRENLFQEMDVDNSGGIDFSEYISLLTAMLGKEKIDESKTLRIINQDTTENSQKVRRLSVAQQIQHGLF